LRPEGLAFLFVAQAALAGFDANGVALGDAEQVVKRHFPNAHCQALQWRSRAADRRCDDSRVEVAGFEGSITFYLKDGAVAAVDLRLLNRDAARFAKLATERYGAPPREKTSEKAHTLEWRRNGERALLSTLEGQRRASFLVWRGDFYDEIYKVR
jgi:hypothetical protein